VAEHLDFSAACLAEALEDLDCGGLPGPIGSEEGEDLSATDVEVDTPHGLVLAVALVQATHADNRRNALWSVDRCRRDRGLE
jgi:hypothetical protein